MVTAEPSYKITQTNKFNCGYPVLFAWACVYAFFVRAMVAININNHKRTMLGLFFTIGKA